MRGRERLIHIYWSALRLALVRIVRSCGKEAGGRCRIEAVRSGPAPARVAPERVAAGTAGTVVAEFWALDTRFASRIARECERRLLSAGSSRGRDGFWPVSSESGAVMVTAAAADLGLVTQTTERIRANAEEAITLVEAALTASRAGGRLKSVNKGYREYRMKCATAGEASMRYSGWIWNFKISLVIELAEHSRLDFGKVKSDICHIANVTDVTSR